MSRKINQKTPSIIGLIIGVILFTIAAFKVEFAALIPLIFILLFQGYMLFRKELIGINLNKPTQQLWLLFDIARNILVIASGLILFIVIYLSSKDGLQINEIIGFSIVGIVFNIVGFLMLKDGNRR